MTRRRKGGMEKEGGGREGWKRKKENVRKMLEREGWEGNEE